MEVLQKRLTYREFRELEFDDHDDAWYELINGELVRKQAPTSDHQAISWEISLALGNYLKGAKSGRAFYAPFDVVLDDGNAYHPDIFFIKKERMVIHSEKERIVKGAPDVVIEILSKSTASDDKGDKKDVYEKYGVKEYWLADPAKRAFEVYSLVNDRFKLTTYLEENGVLKSSVMEGFELDIEQVFEDARI
jgi:Uma2 family endonuclease